MAPIQSRIDSPAEPSRWIGLALALAVPLLGLALVVADTAPVRLLRNAVFDQYQRWSPREQVDVPVRVIDIDEASLARLGQWPWPRNRLAELVERLHQANAAAIALDILLAESDRSSPRAMAELWPLSNDLRSGLMRLPDHDDLLAATLEKSPSVLGFALQQSDSLKAGSAKPANPLDPVPFRFVNSGENPALRVPVFDSAIKALPRFEAVAQGYGSLNFIADRDGIVRKVPLVMRLGDQIVPALVGEVLRVAQGQRNYLLKSSGPATGLTEIRIGSVVIPTTPAGEMWMHYAADSPGLRLPAWQVLDGSANRSLLEGHVVIVGSSAQGLMDLRFSPQGEIIPGVEIHAQALQQILSGQFLVRPGAATPLEAIAILLGGCIVALATIQLGAIRAALVTGLTLTILLAAGWIAFAEHALLVDTVTPSLILAATFACGSLYHHYASERKQRWIRDVFSRYVSPNRVNYLVDHPGSVSLGGKVQECSFVFTDLADFTALMEAIDPREAVDMLNGYLDELIAIAFSFEGTLDRIVGDSVVILFSAPIPQADHRTRALACAQAMDRFAHEYATGLASRGVRFGKTRIGIHAGEVFVGNVGGRTIFDYRALGDPINTASRLESVNKHLGTTLCASEAVVGESAPDNALPVGRLVLKGKTQAIEVFEIVPERELPQRVPRRQYRDAFALLAGADTSSAMAAFKILATAYPEDPLAILHHRRLAEGAVDDLIILTEK